MSSTLVSMYELQIVQSSHHWFTIVKLSVLWLPVYNFTVVYAFILTCFICGSKENILLSRCTYGCLMIVTQELILVLVIPQFCQINLQYTYRPNFMRSEVPVAVLLRIWVSWDMTLWCWVSGSWLLKDPRLECLTIEDEDATILRNIRNHSPSDAVLYCRRPNPCKYNCWNKDHLKETF